MCWCELFVCFFGCSQILIIFSLKRRGRRWNWLKMIGWKIGWKSDGVDVDELIDIFGRRMKGVLFLVVIFSVYEASWTFLRWEMYQSCVFSSKVPFKMSRRKKNNKLKMNSWNSILMMVEDNSLKRRNMIVQKSDKIEIQ